MQFTLDSGLSNYATPTWPSFRLVVRSPNTEEPPALQSPTQETPASLRPGTLYP